MTSVPMTAEQRPYLLVASDMDGTLLDANHDITPFTKRALFRVESERGVPFVFATGRHHLSVRAVRDDLAAYFAAEQAKLTAGGSTSAAPPGFFLVSSNGARVHNDRGELVSQRNLDPAIVKALYAEFSVPYTRKKYIGPPGTATPPLPQSPVTINAQGEIVRVGGEPNGLPSGTSGRDDDEDAVHQGDLAVEDTVSTSAYTTDDWYMTCPFMSDEEMLNKFGIVPQCAAFDPHDPKNEGKSVFDSFPTDGVGKVCFRMSNKNILGYFERTIRERFGDRVTVTLSSNCCLDVMAGGVSKAAALVELAALLTKQREAQQGPGAAVEPITMDRVIAFGDSMNDKEMLKAVGKGCLMKNAQPRLKNALPQCEVIGHHHDDNGVAQKLLEVFQLE